MTASFFSPLIFFYIMGKEFAELKGLNILNGDLRKVVEKLGNVKVKEILVKNAGYVADAVEMKAPKNTGQLQSTIRIFDDARYKYSVIVGPDFKANRAKITAPALISILEFGASAAVAGNISSKSKGNKETNKRGYWHAKIDGKWVTLKERAEIAARPFIRPAFDQTRERVANGIKRDIKEAIKELAKKTKTLNGR